MHRRWGDAVIIKKLTQGWPLAAILVALIAMACGSPTTAVPQPTPDYRALETRVEAMLRATFTAMAPATVSTQTETPEATPAPAEVTPTATPTRLPETSLLAYVQLVSGAEPRLVLEGQRPEDRVELEHLTGPEVITDLAWTPSGEELVLVSAYEASLSRGNERNVFLVRSDGTALQMVTGEYMPPEQAPGPYVALEGQVVGALGACLISAQGVASPVLAEASGEFQLAGVPVGATWARATCTYEGRTLTGDVTLAASDGIFAPVSITVVDGGQGWKQADLSRDGAILAGTFYRWTLDDQGAREFKFWGRVRGLSTGYSAELEVAQEGDLNGVDWSPVDDRLVGALTGGDGGWLWLWDVTGASLGQLAALPNPDDEILTLANPAWSPDGKEVVFEVRRWSWWGDSAYRTDLMLVSADGQNLRSLVELDWGEHAAEPGWLPDGSNVVYQYSRTAPSQELAAANNGSIWMVDIATGLRLPWTSGPGDYAPALNPRGLPTPQPRAAPTAGTG